MEPDGFEKDIDRLLKSGASEADYHDLELEPFHRINAVRGQIKSFQRTSFLLATLLLILVIAAALFFMRERKIQEHQIARLQKLPLAAVDTIENLKIENDRLRLRISQLENDIAAEKNKKPVLHYVRDGETVFFIAKKYFGDELQYRKLLKDNNLKEPRELYPGMELKIYLPE